jgi:hypothetical protein
MYKRISTTLPALVATLSALGGATLAGCYADHDESGERLGTAESEITDVPHTPVERQSIGNCWLYAQATWVESMNLAAQQAGNPGGGTPNTCAHSVCAEGEKLDPACSECATIICSEDVDPYCCNTEWDDICTGRIAEHCGADACNDSGGGGEVEVTELDVSQSYWTYWHWFDQVTGYMYDDEISTGGNQWKSHGIVRDRGLMREQDFVPEDSNSEMSNRQSSALNKINDELKSGRLADNESRQNGALVRDVFDEAWGLSSEVSQQLDQVFGEDGEATLRSGGSIEGTNLIDPATLPVRYTKWVGDHAEVKDTNLVEAVAEWNTVRYPGSSADRREYLRRIQLALHDRQPVVITWDVDFNAMENGQNERRGSFNMTTLNNAGRPGSQGGHMTVLNDYKANTDEFGVLEAGVTLDPNNPEDAAKLAAALLPTTEIMLLRVKNSWGGERPDRAFAPGFPGYHDLYMDYLNGPIKFCPSVDNPTNDNCHGESVPLNDVMLPPGY